MLGSWMTSPRSYGIPYRAVSTLAISNPTTFTNLSFLVNGVERMTITPYGDIGIATQAPSAKLHISGGAASTGLALNVEIRHPSSLAREEGREWMLNGEPGRVFVSGSRRGRARHADPGRFVFQ